jgi:hypothetical protein
MVMEEKVLNACGWNVTMTAIKQLFVQAVGTIA